MIHIWRKRDSEKFNNVIETEANFWEDKIEPFEIMFKDKKITTQTVGDEIYEYVYGRNNCNDQPGLTSSYSDDLNKVSDEEIIQQAYC